MNFWGQWSSFFLARIAFLFSFYHFINQLNIMWFWLTHKFSSIYFGFSPTVCNQCFEVWTHQLLNVQVKVTLMYASAVGRWIMLSDKSFHVSDANEWNSYFSEGVSVYDLQYVEHKVSDILLWPRVKFRCENRFWILTFRDEQREELVALTNQTSVAVTIIMTGLMRVRAHSTSSLHQDSLRINMTFLGSFREPLKLQDAFLKSKLPRPISVMPPSKTGYLNKKKRRRSRLVTLLHSKFLYRYTLKCQLQ